LKSPASVSGALAQALCRYIGLQPETLEPNLTRRRIGFVCTFRRRKNGSAAVQVQFEQLLGRAIFSLHPNERWGFSGDFGASLSEIY